VVLLVDAREVSASEKQQAGRALLAAALGQRSANGFDPSLLVLEETAYCLDSNPASSMHVMVYDTFLKYGDQTLFSVQSDGPGPLWTNRGPDGPSHSCTLSSDKLTLTVVKRGTTTTHDTRTLYRTRFSGSGT